MRQRLSPGNGWGPAGSSGPPLRRRAAFSRMERYRMTSRHIRRGLLGAALTVLAGAAFAQSSTDTGIPACDRYYRAYEVCIMQRLPEAQRSIFRQTLERNRADIREQTADPEDRASAERTCQEQRQQSARFFAPHGCTFD